MQPNPRTRITRRSALRVAALGAAASSLSLVDALALRPRRIVAAAPNSLPAIQFDVADFISPAEAIDGTLFRFGPVFTLFITARVTRAPSRADQQSLDQALAAIETAYAFDPSGVFVCVGYGIPYFERLPGGMRGDIVSQAVPRLLLDRRRLALEEAMPAPSDVAPSNPDVAKQTFNVPVVIEQNDLLLTLRSDVRDNLFDVLDWLTGSETLAGATRPSPSLAGLWEVTSTRLMFVQRGLPRKLADAETLPYASRIHPDSPMWMGFASQQADSSAAAAAATFAGNSSAQFTTAAPGDYFAEASIQHLSHAILDLAQWYAEDEPYRERVQHMFRSNPLPAAGNEDQFSDGGGPVFLPNDFRGRDDARQNAVGFQTLDGQRRLGHTTALQRASRAGDGKPIHLRVDGAGYDALDVPDGTSQPKLHFSMFVPTAEVFERMRRYQAGADLADAYGLTPRVIGLERFTTTTRRQNFLVPPRRHRAFPLVELT